VVRPLETPRAAGVAGLAFAALFIASVLLLRTHPAGDSTPAEIRDFYGAALVLILNVSYIELPILVFPAWVAAVSVVILTARGPERPAPADRG
jgi:hypothetical protein